MKDRALKTVGGILGTGFLIEAVSFFYFSGSVSLILPAFACIAAVAYHAAGEREAVETSGYIKAGIIGLAAGILFVPFSGTAAAAMAGIVFSPAGSLSALAVFSEMNKNGEERFSPVFSVFSGSMIAGMFITATGPAGAAFSNPGFILREFTSLLIISLLAGMFCQGILIVLKKENQRD